MGFISDFVSRKVEEATIKNTKSVSRKVVGKIYGKAAGKVTESIYNKTLTKIDESNNEKMVIGSQEELLARNPQNSKLIFLPQDSELKIQDRDGRQKYRIYQAVFFVSYLEFIWRKIEENCIGKGKTTWDFKKAIPEKA